MFKFYGSPFVISFLLSVSFCLILIYFFRKKNSGKIRNGTRHIHENKLISRFGGVAIIFSFIATLFFNRNIVFDHLTLVMLIGVVMIFILGLLDDVWELDWKVQLFFQILIISFIFYFGIQIEFITNPLGGLIVFNLVFSFIFTLVWMLIIINTVNWSDGIDGLMGGIIFFASIALFFLSLRPEVNQPPLAIISVVLVGSILGFMIFNFPPASIFAGTGGVFAVGYLISVLAIFAGAKIGTTLLVLIVPLTDAFFVVWQRWREGQSFFQADMRHLHHRLLQLGWSQKKIIILYYFITVIGMIVAFSTSSVNKFFAFVLFFMTVLTFCFVVDKLVKKMKIE